GRHRRPLARGDRACEPPRRAHPQVAAGDDRAPPRPREERGGAAPPVPAPAARRRGGKLFLRLCGEASATALAERADGRSGSAAGRSLAFEPHRDDAGAARGDEAPLPRIRHPARKAAEGGGPPRGEDDAMGSSAAAELTRRTHSLLRSPRLNVMA